MVVRGFGPAVALSIAILCAACEGDACDEVAVHLRECCDKGPTELRDSCEDEAELLENDGNTEACEADLDSGAFARCSK